MVSPRPDVYAWTSSIGLIEHFIRCFKQMTGLTPRRYQTGHGRTLNRER